jgi:tetratricopeptide (TPR) repeat protein
MNRIRHGRSSTRHGRPPTGAPPLHRLFRAGIGLAIAWGLVLLVCWWGEPTTGASEAPLDVMEVDPAALDEVAKLSARPMQAASPTGPEHSTDVAYLPCVKASWPGGETQAQYQPLPAQLSATAAPDSEPLEAISLPPVEGTDDVDVAEVHGSEPIDAGRRGSSAAGPALESPSDIGPTRNEPVSDDKPTAPRPALSPDFAAAFAVQPKRSIEAEDRLAPLSGPSDPTPALIAVANQADAHIARGFELAQRGATCTARAEFIRALRLSAAALDEQRQTVAHSRAVSNGLRAMEEAEEFVSAAAVGQMRSIEAILAGHQTPILQDEPADGLTPSQALQRYLNYAQDQLAAAAGDLQPAAMALYALGKLEITATSAEIGSLAVARAAVYFQAALIVNPQHAMAANELGVLLAGHGRLEEAKAALLHSVRTAPQAAAWRNLAIVHHRLGEVDLAIRADWESRQVASARTTGRAIIGAKPMPDVTAPAVEWVDPVTFAKSANGASGVPLPAAPPQSAAQVRSTTATPASNTKSASHWWPWPRKTH